ncbi:transcription-repair coupling factor [Agrococcus sp. ARC_14]|uniref:transcription-repair coupling factor n=1 Tax=Agrococcus sp. ARC_14 TaxID=2919927 RepID=UPI001F0700D4|nr:transcription-repair coupling factor [Agrococcus sp. ARC_14]
MSLQPLLELLQRSALEPVVEASVGGALTGIEAMRAPVVATLASTHERPLLVVTATRREAEAVRDDLRAWLPEAQILDLPAWETLPHERLSPSAETVGQRGATLRAVAERDPSRPTVIIASVRAALQPVADNLLDVAPVELVAGARGVDLTALSRQLVDLAYARVDMVTRRGEFAVRGGIVDVFSPAEDHPVRIELFGDEVDQMRWFHVADQRSDPDPVERIVLPPSRELLLTEAVRTRARQLAPEFPGIRQMLEKIAEGMPVEGMESLAPALLERLVPITHYLPGAGVVVLGPERIRDRVASLNETNQEFLEASWSAATAGGLAPVDLSSGFLSLDELRAAVDAPWWTFSVLAADETVTAVEGQPVPSFTGVADGAVAHLREHAREGWRIVVTAAGHGLVDRAAQVLGEHEVGARVVDALPVELEPGVVHVTQASVEHGFLLPDERIELVSEAEFFGRAVGVDARQPHKLAGRRRSVVDPLQLKAGDYVVHETHGVGRFVELTQRTVSSGGRNPVKTTREYLVIEYSASKRGHPGDRLSVPTDQLDQLNRYVGGEAPQLSKMGGSDWQQSKAKARKAVREIAVELVQLYSKRMASKGRRFGPDSPWQRELEDAFPYAETPDQLTTIDEVKRDMEREVPMDRLLSGDVGYGKTEVAVRAAFKAVQDGTQVAVLVPTTLLVRQHFETFAARFAGFPVQVRALSRFQSDKEVRETIAGITDGTVDVVIGTHRILSENVHFKELGLVIIDEEQRFGVEHKERLKSLKTNVDVLSMSATPIPRTLEMAVTGIREMSTLATPPEARHPVLTFVGAYNEQQVAAAIRRELLREGQIFFVHNRVSSINRVAAQLAELVPEARIGVAHGKMHETALERVIVDFWEKQYDVLVSTTIVETGLDIPNANTLIVDHAERYGLSQLHQLRGRVGRGRERAYAYFLYDGEKPLSETAHDRLETIAVHNELGAGMQVALKDLEIRGAGNLLGGEQSGHIAGVGFDLYLRMVGEAVAVFRGEKDEGPRELRLELPVDAVIPEDYVDSERLRLEAYQKLSAAASARDDGAIDHVLDELRDRYGEPPSQVAALIAIARLRRKAQAARLSEVITVGPNLRVGPAELADSVQLRLRRMYPDAKLNATAKTIVVPIPTAGGGRLAGTQADALPDAELIEWVDALLTAIFPPPKPVAEPEEQSA